MFDVKLRHDAFNHKEFRSISQKLLLPFLQLYTRQKLKCDLKQLFNFRSIGLHYN